MLNNKFQFISLVALLLTVVVVTLGAYVRLSHAGLGCPDWPGCYGKMLGIPKGESQVNKANSEFPERPVESAKAWKEVIHRYFAGGLGLFVLVLAVMAWRMRKRNPRPLKISLFLLPLIVLQALLGMWTVTEKLDPFFVTAHLLMGFLTLALLGFNYFRERLDLPVKNTKSGALGAFAILTAALVVGQIFLGGWTSTNYAATVCHDFPTCYDKQWLPKQDFKEAFVIWRGDEINYEGGILKHDARISIHMTHRLGAVIAGFFVLMLSLILMLKGRSKILKVLGVSLLLLVCLQITLGISIVLLSLPLGLAVAHNGVAALLFTLILVTVAVIRRRD